MFGDCLRNYESQQRGLRVFNINTPVRNVRKGGVPVLLSPYGGIGVPFRTMFDLFISTGRAEPHESSNHKVLYITSPIKANLTCLVTFLYDPNPF